MKVVLSLAFWATSKNENKAKIVCIGFFRILFEAQQHAFVRPFRI